MADCSTLRRVAGILHEPEGDVDAGGFLLDEIEENRAAVFTGRIAQAIRRRRLNGKERHPCDR